MRGARRVLEVFALVLILSGVPGGLAVKGAESELGGYVLGAVATGVSWVYDQPSFGVPASPLWELNETHAESRLESGPTAYGLGSFLWPGQFIANAPPAADPDAPGYPVRAETFYPQGPEERSDAVGPAQMGSFAHADESGATTRGTTGTMPDVVTAHGRRSSTHTRVEGGLAISDAVTTLTEVSLFGGIIHIDSITSRAHAESDGENASAHSSIAVKGLTIDGHAVRLEGARLHLDGNDVDPGSTVVLQALRQVLEEAGIQLYLAEPLDMQDGGMASTSIGGLIVTFTSSAFEPYKPQLPEFIPPEFSDPALDHSGVLVLAPAAAEARAAPAFEFDFPPVDTDDGPFVLGGTAGTPGSEEFIPGTDTVIEHPGRTAATPDEPIRRAGSGIPIPDIFGGIPLALLGLLLGAVTISSRLLARAAESALAGSSGVCPYKEDV